MSNTVLPVAEVISGYSEFELDLVKVIRQHLPPVIDLIDAAPLTKENVDALPEKVQGVYLLFEDGNPTYVGKTDAKHGIRDRLSRHFSTLSARKGLDLSKISFKAVRILVFTVVNVEDTLIEVYTKSNPSSWQNTGFGSNDPGHNRESQKPSRFDQTYPVDIDFPLQEIDAGHYAVKDLLVAIKDLLPFDFRYQTDVDSNRKPAKYTVGHVDQILAHVDVPRKGMTLRQLLQDILLPSLPDGWVATVFPGRVILYKDGQTYSHKTEQLRKL